MVKDKKKRASKKEIQQTLTGLPIVKRAIQSIAESITKKSSGVDSPALEISKLIYEAGDKLGTPFSLKGNNPAIRVNDKNYIIKHDIIVWLVEIVAYKTGFFYSRPLNDKNAAELVAQFRHTVGKNQFSKPTKAA